MTKIVLAALAVLLVWDWASSETDQSALGRAGRIIGGVIASRTVEPPASEPTVGDLSRDASIDEAPAAPACVPALAPPALPPQTGAKHALGDNVFSEEAITLFIAEASTRTGVSEDYLTTLARKESAFDPLATARRSSAAGLFQFVEDTWFDLFSKYGGEYGLQQLSVHIEQTPNGLAVASPRARRAILNYRHDPRLSPFLAARYALDNKALLQRSLGREIVDQDLLVAHFLGAAGAERLYSLAADRPDASAVKAFPAAARANPAIFHGKNGAPVSVAQLKSALSGPTAANS